VRFHQRTLHSLRVAGVGVVRTCIGGCEPVVEEATPLRLSDLLLSPAAGSKARLIRGKVHFLILGDALDERAGLHPSSKVLLLVSGIPLFDNRAVLVARSVARLMGHYLVQHRGLLGILVLLLRHSIEWLLPHFRLDHRLGRRTRFVVEVSHVRCLLSRSRALNLGLVGSLDNGATRPIGSTLADLVIIVVLLLRLGLLVPLGGYRQISILHGDLLIFLLDRLLPSVAEVAIVLRRRCADGLGFAVSL